MYTTNYRVKTKYRVKTIAVWADLAMTKLLRAYKLSYDPMKPQSLLSQVQQSGKDAIINTSGSITGGASYPNVSLTYTLNGTGLTKTIWPTDPDGMVMDGQTYELEGDFNGDGKADIALTRPGWNGFRLRLSNGSSFTSAWWATDVDGMAMDKQTYVLPGDFNGDGKTDIALLRPDWTGFRLRLSNGDSFTSAWWETGWNGMWADGQTYVLPGDFNGDGKTDIALTRPTWNAFRVHLSNSTSFISSYWATDVDGMAMDKQTYVLPGDFNGDGKTDIALLRPDWTGFRLRLSNGDSFTSAWWETGWNGMWADGQTYVLPGDFNGDGKTDIALTRPTWNAFRVHLSNSTSFISSYWATDVDGMVMDGQTYVLPGDFNGDGKTDIALTRPTWNGFRLRLSNGDSFTSAWWGTDADGMVLDGQTYVSTGDFNGDGKADIAYTRPTWNAFSVAISNGPMGDFMNSISNGLGGATTITYAPSTQWPNTQLPFPAQRVNAISSCDNWNAATTICNSPLSTTTYSYAGGFYHLGERDLRGVSYVKVTGQAAANGDQTISETWFHQGSRVDAVAETLTELQADTVASTKGLPFRTKVTDQTGKVYSDSTTTYLADPDSAAPWFTPPAVVTTSIYDSAGVLAKETQTESVTYDAYGNLTLAYNRGDATNTNAVTSDDTTTAVTFGNYDTTNWLVAFPTVTTTYAGLGTGDTKLSETKYFYDGTGSCTTPAGSNTTVTKGHVTKVERWLNGGTNPISGMEYNAYGSLTCTRDPKGHVTTLAYDSATNTFPLTSTNALGHVTTTSYYGVNGVATDTGLYGQAKSVTDPNNQTGTSTYDALGRKLTTTTPDGLVSTMAYNYGSGFGVGTQHIQSTTSGGGLSTNLVSKTFFDGLGRTTRKESPGAADGGANLKVLVTETQYDVRGLVKQSSLPYMQGTESATGRWRVPTYDALGRMIQSTNPDGTSSQVCYNGWTTTSLDPKLHKKVETKDAYGRLVTVQEYTGQATSGTCAGGTLYATTNYQYDLLGNLLSVTDTKGNASSMTYDTLGRKVTMHDPDMGNWSYTYDANGNLLTQVDAKSQKLCFTYDELNRRRQKNFGTTTVPCGSLTIIYRYDDTVTTYNRIGRLRQVVDPAQSVTFQYDSRGRITQSAKILDGTTYMTTSAYDGLGRLTSVSYPTNPITTVAYNYDGPQLKSVLEGATTYVTYAGWNALGQAATATFGNGVVTTTTYANTNNTTCTQQTFQLCTLKTQKEANPLYQDLRYDYEANGNVWNIYDNTVASNAGDQYFSYDDLDRLTLANGPYGASGANASLSYGYDPIGNLTSSTQPNAVGQPMGAYAYPNSNASSVGPHAVCATGGSGLNDCTTGTLYTYDANGNMLTGAGRTLTWNQENKPLTIVQGGTTTTFVYDGDGGRVKKIVGTTTTRYISKLYECDNTNCSRFIWAGSTRIATIASNGTINYWHGDHLGSSSVITDSTGNKVETITYYPFGGTRTNTSPTTPAIDVPYKYTGKELDASTGLYYYEARYYDATLARFISADTIVPNPRDPQSFNRYSYVENNPLKYIDPTGHFKIKGLFKGLNKFIQNNMALRVLGWIVNPAQMVFLDPTTRAPAVSAVAGLTTTVLTGNPVLGGMAAGAVGGYMNQLEGREGNIIKSALAGGAAASVSLGLGGNLNPLLTAAAAGATHSAVMGGDPGTGAWMGAATALGMGAVQLAVLKMSLPTYNASVPAPADSLGYVLPDSPGSYAISALDGGPFSHTVTTDANGNLMGATVGGSQAAQYQTVGSIASLEGRQILWVQGVLSSGAAVNALSSSLGVSYNILGIGGLNCAEFGSRALANSGISANGLSPNGQYYELMGIR